MRSIIAVAVLALVVLAEKKKDITHGFRDDINWVEYDQAVSIAKDLNKPIFFLIHKTWCGACKNLKREFKNSPKILDLLNLSNEFVMVNVEDDEEPKDEKFAPDGGYIPRILFLDTDGNPLKTNNEKRYRNNKYFYPLVPQVIEGMQNALKEFKGEGEKEEKKEEKVEKKEEKKEKKEEKKEKKEEKKEKKEEKKEDKKKEEKKEKKEKKEDEKKKEKKEEKKEKKEEKKDKKEDKKKDEKKKDAKKGKKDEKEEKKEEL